MMTTSLKAMSESLKKSTSNACENLLTAEEQQEKINELRRLVGPLPDKLSCYCSDALISRHLRAWNWNINKATKMLKENLKWRLEYKPEEIRWDEVACEAETGKIYRSNYVDKHGRTVLVMRPSCQNSKSTSAQIRYLVYCMENAILNLPQNQEQMIWLIDFHGFNLSNISFKVSRETAHVLQVHYPERLGDAILYNPPKFFEPFYRLVKPFLEQKTANKVKFVYSDDPNTKKIMEDLFDIEQLDSAFGGKDNTGFDIHKYAERMREDDKRMASLVAAHRPVLTTDTCSNPTNSVSDSDASDEKVDKSSHGVNVEDFSPENDLPVPSGCSKPAGDAK
ncbi:hypothetical protein F0562_027376 [Nyssa sinensis]|uniref:CRAL-TRIO domain-containing protein n=1 Tax=Nyssa sinensis TaxID=561372 RepID=A0A5J5B650_9ASTE|nr:hypothetical protein F0562_027376 [Nyssa sinensis]